MELQTIQADNGGRPAANDDFLALQSQPLALGLPALLLDMPPCVVSGCKVYKTGSLWNVGAGMVWDGATLLPYSGQFNVTLPAMFQPGAVQVLDQRAYQTGGTKNTILGQSMELVPVVAGAPNLVIDTYGALTFWHRVQEKTRSAKQVEWVAAVTLANYDAQGLGLPGTEAWGWALANGQGGRVDMMGGRVAVALDPNRSDYDTVGKTGGEEKHTLNTAEMPRHRMRIASKKVDAAVRNPDWSTISSGTSGNASNGPNDDANFTEYIGGDQPHENRMPFMTLLARVWVGY